MVDVTLPIRLYSLANGREHWRVKADRARSQRQAAILVPRHALPCVVTITRKGPRKLDSDNLAISAKHLRDGIADRLRVNDNDPRIEWRYQQEVAHGYSARVQIEPMKVAA